MLRVAGRVRLSFSDFASVSRISCVVFNPFEPWSSVNFYFVFKSDAASSSALSNLKAEFEISIANNVFCSTLSDLILYDLILLVWDHYVLRIL